MLTYVNMVTLVVVVFWSRNELFHLTSIALGWGESIFNGSGREGVLFFLTSIRHNVLSLVVPILTVRFKLTNLNFEKENILVPL